MGDDNNVELMSCIQKELLNAYPIFYNSKILNNSLFTKLYQGKNVENQIKKMVAIYNKYNANPLVVTFNNEKCTVSRKYQPCFRPLVDHDAYDLYKKAGEAVAKLHLFLDKEFTRKSDYPTIYDEVLFNRFIKIAEKMQLSNIISKQEFLVLTRNIDECIKCFLNNNMGGIHCDVNKENILTHNEKVLLIDFDMIGYGNRLFDFVVPYNSFSKTEHFYAYLEGYLGIRKNDFRWDELAHAKFLSRCLCIMTNITQLNNYSWVYTYIKYTIEYFTVDNCRREINSKIFK